MIPSLRASTSEPLPFAPALQIRAFLLQRERGNVLVYSVTGLESDATAIEDAGGIARQYLNHRHEAIFASSWVKAPLFVHERERESVAKKAHVRDDFEVIPTRFSTACGVARITELPRRD